MASLLAMMGLGQLVTTGLLIGGAVVLLIVRWAMQEPDRPEGIHIQIVEHYRRGRRP